MKVWYKYIPKQTFRMPTKEDFRNNRNLRRFRLVRIGFMVGNPMVAVVVLLIILLQVL
ncbi:MAG TPA: hypothetical protein VKU79_07305 [Thermoplasmataceae archaeon]|nr:hypothetical protein [Thermoplasmatales archaeon AK]HLH86653.1 hypothetical protein [Thermoplasmataceae archaeon]